MFVQLTTDNGDIRILAADIEAYEDELTFDEYEKVRTGTKVYMKSGRTYSVLEDLSTFNGRFALANLRRS